jgi:hypothetical protein
MQSVITMTREEARQAVDAINRATEDIGQNLLRLKETGGWQLLADGEGNPYANWTDFLSRAFTFSRKHLYELMQAAPVIERLAARGYQVNHSQAVALSRFSPEVQVLTFEMALKRGAATEERIKDLGSVLQTAEDTGGYVPTEDGEQIALENAINGQRRESSIAKRYYLARGEFTIRRISGSGELMFIGGIPLDPSGSTLVEKGDLVHVSVWIPNPDEEV